MGICLMDHIALIQLVYGTYYKLSTVLKLGLELKTREIRIPALYELSFWWEIQMSQWIIVVAEQ